MVYNFGTQDSASVLRVQGELDASSVLDLRPTIGKIVDERPRLLFVDLSDLRLIDSTGVGAIVALYKAVRSYNGSMAVLGAREQPLAMFRILNLDRVLMGQAAH